MPYTLENARPLTVREARRRHARMSREYFNSSPTIGNVYNGVVNWLKSKQILTPDNTGMTTGAAPAAGRRIPKLPKGHNPIQRMLRTEKYNKDYAEFARTIERGDIYTGPIKYTDFDYMSPGEEAATAGIIGLVGGGVPSTLGMLYNTTKRRENIRNKSNKSKTNKSK